MAQGPTDLLQRVPIFQGLEPRELERIGSSMKQRTFNAGDTVTAEGTGGVGFFVIESGQARVTIGGKDRRTLYITGGGHEIEERGQGSDLPV